MHRTRSQGEPEVQPQPKITAYLRKVRKEFLKQRDMVEQNQNRGRQWGEYFAPKLDNTRIIRELDTECYYISPALISLVQNGAIFQILENKDPTTHITSFLNLCDTTKPTGLTHNEMRKMLFPFSLRGQALNWYTSSGLAAIEAFKDIVRKFIAKYYPPSKIEKLRHAVANF